VQPALRQGRAEFLRMQEQPGSAADPGAQLYGEKSTARSSASGSLRLCLILEVPRTVITLERQ